MANPTNTDWARLAAYIDGEGCISVQVAGYARKRRSRDLRGRFILSIVIGNTDIRLPIWCKETFGLGHLERNHKTSAGKPFFSWKVTSAAAEIVLKNCLPYFVVKVDQARIGLALRSTVNTGKGRKSVLTPTIIAERESLKLQLSALHKNPQSEVSSWPI